MKIAYYTYWMEGFESGVFKKITAQINAWKLKKHTVKLFISTIKGSEIEKDIQNKGQSLPFDIEFIRFSGRIGEISNTFSVFNTIDNYQPDLIYMRESNFSPSLYRLNKKYNTIVEINSILNNELRKNSLGYWFNKITLYSKFKNIKAFIFVTNEISKHSIFSDFSAEKHVIANGIDLQQEFNITNKNQTQTNLVFIGSDGQTWHGVDKIMELAVRKKDWNFHIIGVSSKHESLENVTYYGRLDKKEYEAVFSISDVAIGTLALYRNSMQEACPLKTREYLAYGLPIIIGYDDVDFPDKYDFVCQLQNNKDNILTNLDKIEKFVNFWKGQRINSKNIKHIDVTYKENKRLTIFTKLVK